MTCIQCDTPGDMMPASLQLKANGEDFFCLACQVDDSLATLPTTYESMMAEIATLSEAQVEALYESESLQDDYLARLADSEEAIRLALEFDNLSAAHEIMKDDDDVETRLHLCEKFNLAVEDCDAAFADREHAAYVNGMPY